MNDRFGGLDDKVGGLEGRVEVLEQAEPGTVQTVPITLIKEVEP